MKKIRAINLSMLLFFAGAGACGQSILLKNISLDINHQRLDNVLEILSNKGDFYFSYNSGVIRKDSLVSLSVRNRTVKDVLNLLFNNTYEFRESGNYVIIRKVPIRITAVTNKTVTEERIYVVSGYIYDEHTGAAISEASVYEKKLLASALTNNQGYFRLKLKSGKAGTATFTVSKQFYEDTSIVIEPRHNQQLSITMMPVEKESEKIVITPADYLAPDSLKNEPVIDTAMAALTDSAADQGRVERTGVGKFLLSTRQKIQSLNLRKFFTTRAYQVSLTPGLGSHGKMSGQVVNNISLNVLGGYTAGTKGVEIGGLFNIDKKEVKYFQAAGIFNVAGGRMDGMQVAGVNNSVLDNTKGFQAAGVNNIVKGSFTGFQVSGVYNHVTDSVKGVQVAGVVNFSSRNVSGVQIGGVGNFSNKETRGVQVAGVVNYTKKLKGLQIGLINISDTSDGFSIGLLNIVLKGYHKLSFSANEVLNINVAFKTGNPRLYNILQAGLNTGVNQKIYLFGYGLGGELPLNKRKAFSINPELTSQFLYLGSFDYTNILNRFCLNFNVKLNKYISLFAGPSYSVFVSDQKTGIAGYRFPIPSKRINTNSFSNNVSGWFGWSAGVNFF